MSLRFKLLLPLLLTTAAIAAGLYGLWMPRALAEAEADYLRLVDRHLETVEEGLVPLLLGSQIDLIHENLDALRAKNSEWVAVRLVDGEHRQIYPLRRERSPAAPRSASARTLVKEMATAGVALARLEVDVDLGDRTARSREKLGQVARSLLLVLGGMLLAAVLVLELAVRRPVTQLAAAARGLAKQDFTTPLPRIVGDEVGGMVASFALMRDQLRQFQTELYREIAVRRNAEEQLRILNRDLETRVAERTAELRREVEVRARAEEALLSSRERLKAITDHLFEGVLVVSSAGVVTFANASAKRLLAWDAAEEELEGQLADAIFRLRERGRDLGFEGSPWQRAAAGAGVTRDEDAIFVTRGGKALQVAYACSALSADGGPAAAIVSFRDISPVKEVQREALRASRLASVGQLAAGIAHEINTPAQYLGDNLHFIGDELPNLVTAAGAGRDLAQRAGAGAELAEPLTLYQSALAGVDLPFLERELPTAVQQSLEGVAHIARLVSSMREFSGPGTSAKSLIDVNRSLENTLVLSTNRWSKTAEVEKSLDPALPPVLGNGGDLNQVFLNLILNAAQAIEASGKPGPGRISISTAREGELVVVRVADTGTGIPKALKDSIFDPFFTTKEVGKGTGLGLAICHDVVRKHGGTIEVGGAEGEGAVFTVRLPAASKAGTA